MWALLPLVYSVTCSHLLVFYLLSNQCARLHIPLCEGHCRVLKSESLACTCHVSLSTQCQTHSRASNRHPPTNCPTLPYLRHTLSLYAVCGAADLYKMFHS